MIQHARADAVCSMRAEARSSLSSRTCRQSGGAAAGSSHSGMALDTASLATPPRRSHPPRDRRAAPISNSNRSRIGGDGSSGSSSGSAASSQRGQRQPRTAAAQWRCPTCQQPLAPVPGGAALQCARGHTISVARPGHVNLLPAGRLQSKSAADAGDSEAMVRRRLLYLGSGASSVILIC